MGNISRLAGHDVSVRYSYAIDKNDIAKAFNQMRDELNYPLQVDSRNRRAIVYNKKGLEKKIQKMVDECIIYNVKLMEDMIINDVVNGINSQLNGIIQMGTMNSKSNNSSVKIFSSAVTKGLINGLSGIVNDIINDNDY